MQFAYEVGIRAVDFRSGMELVVAALFPGSLSGRPIGPYKIVLRCVQVRLHFIVIVYLYSWLKHKSTPEQNVFL